MPKALRSMGNAVHHRIKTAGATLNLRAVAAFPAAPPLVAPQKPYYSARPAVKWTRYGYWDELGIVFTPTRVL